MRDTAGQWQRTMPDGALPSSEVPKSTSMMNRFGRSENDALAQGLGERKKDVLLFIA